MQNASFSILVENEFASGETKRPRGPRSSLSMVQPQLNLQECALTYFQRYHLQATVVQYMDGCLGDTIEAWQASRTHCSMVELAISTLALAVFARAQCHLQAAYQASTRYGKLLQNLQYRIGSSICEQDLHACILAVLIISRYDGAQPLSNLAQHALPSSLLNWSHHDGIVALLKSWHDNFRSSPASIIIQQSRRVVMRSYLLRVMALPNWLLDGERFGEVGLDSQYDRLNVRLINHRSQTSVSLHQHNLHHSAGLVQGSNNVVSLNSDLARLDSDLAQLDSDLQAWATLIPSSHAPSLHTIPNPGPLPRKHIYSTSIYSFDQPGHSVIWTRYFTARMLTASSRLQINAALLPTYSCDFDVCLQASIKHSANLHFLVESIISCIPFALGIVKVDTTVQSLPDSGYITIIDNEGIKPHQANTVLWPLMIGSGLKGIETKQQKWLRSELAEIGKALNDGTLENVEWPTF